MGVGIGSPRHHLGPFAAGRGYFGRHAFPILPSLIRHSIIFLMQLPGGNTRQVEGTRWHVSSQDSQILQYICKGLAEIQLKGLSCSVIKVTRKAPAAPERGWGCLRTCQPQARQCPRPKARRRSIPVGTGMDGMGTGVRGCRWAGHIPWGRAAPYISRAGGGSAGRAWL